MVTGSPLGATTTPTTVSATVTVATAKPVILTFRGFDLDDFDNSLGQLQVLVNGHLVVDIPAGLNHLSGSGDYTPYTNRWVNFGPFDITDFIVQGQNTVVFKNPLTSHFGLVRNVTVTQGSAILLQVRHASSIYPGHPTTYTFSVPSLSVASFAVSTTTPLVDQSETFSATYTSGTAPFTCTFKFGDGESVTIPGSAGSCSVIHDYDSSGKFKATLTVRGVSTSDTVSSRLVVNVA